MRRPPSRLHRAAILGASALVALLVIAVVVVLYAAAVAGRRVHEGAEAEAARIGARIGRAVSVGPALLRFVPELSIEVKEIRVAGAAGEAGVAAEPLLEIASVRVRVAWWPLVRSLGKRVEVTRIDARDPLVRVVRLPGGKLSYADVLDHLANAPPRPEPARRVSIGRVDVRGGTLRLYDLSTGTDPEAAPLSVRHVDLAVPALRTGAPVDLTIDAALLADTPNLHLALTLAPAPEPGDAPSPPAPLGRLRRAEVHLAPVAIAPLVPFLPATRGFRVQGATLSADARCAVDPAGSVTLDGTLAAAALTLARDGTAAPALSQPTDVRIRADLTVDPATEAVAVRTLDVSAGDMALEAQADLRGPATAPEVRALSVQARGLTFERLLALVPPALVPPGVALHGPIALHAEGHGDAHTAAIDLSLDLGDASLDLPDLLLKPAGTPLSVALRAHTAERGLDVTSCGLTLGPLALALSGTIASAQHLDLAFDSGPVPLDALLRLLPAVARATPAGVTLAGDVQAAGHVHREEGATHADARVALHHAGVKTPALTLEGDATLVADLRLPHAAAVPEALVADLDAKQAHVVVPGRLDKAAGAPLAIHLAAERAGTVTTVRDARLTLNGATLQASGRYDSAAHAVAIEAPAVDLDLGALARTLPALGVVPAALAGAHLHTALALEADPRDLASAHLRLSGLDLTAPITRGDHLRGLLDLDGLSPLRRILVDLDGDTLDLEALEASRAGVATAGHTPALADLTLEGKIHLAHLHTRDQDPRDLTAEGALTKGVADLRVLRFALYGAAVDASGSRLDLTRGAPAFSLRAKVAHLDLTAPHESHWSKGRLDADVALDGQGATWAAIAPTLTGTVAVDVADGHVLTVHAIRATILNPFLRKLAEKSKEKHPVRALDMVISHASFRLRAGKNQIATTAPARAETDDGTLTLEGTVGFDGRLALDGLLLIPPAVLQKATSGKLVPFHDVPIKVRMTGDAGDPDVTFLDLRKTFDALAGAGAHALAQKLQGLFDR